MAYREEEMTLMLPASVQLLLSGGDRYLAANISAFRSQTSGVFDMSENGYRVLGETQLAASLLNPYHEDNYWTAGANLAWNNQVPMAQTILERASQARTWDEMPLFFHGFNRFYFLRDMQGAAKDAQAAAARSVGGQQLAMLGIASRWVEWDEDATTAISMMQGMLAGTSDRNTRRLINARIDRLKGLMLLKEAARKYKKEQGKGPEKLKDLVAKGYLEKIPPDPFKRGYGLDAKGEPTFIAPGRKVVTN